MAAFRRGLSADGIGGVAAKDAPGNNSIIHVIARKRAIQ
jgi:hypothetical protein